VSIVNHLLRSSPVFELEPGVLVHAELDDYMVRAAFLGDFTSEPAFRLSRSLLRPGDVVLDVGANVGLWAMGAARLTGAHGRVVAFEPVPATVYRLRRNIQANRVHVEVEQVALHDASGPLTIFGATHGNSGGAGLLRRNGVDRPLTVQGTRLDDYVIEKGIRGIDFLKIDVEGAESIVLRGAGSLLEEPGAPIVLFEVNPEASQGLGLAHDAAARVLVAAGYRLYQPTDDGLREMTEVPRQAMDLVACKQPHLERLMTATQAPWAMARERLTTVRPPAEPPEGPTGWRSIAPTQRRASPRHGRNCAGNRKPAYGSERREENDLARAFGLTRLVAIASPALLGEGRPRGRRPSSG